MQNGRSVYYHIGNYGGYGVDQLDQVSQIVPTGTASPPIRYSYGFPTTYYYHIDGGTVPMPLLERHRVRLPYRLRHDDGDHQLRRQPELRR